MNLSARGAGVVHVVNLYVLFPLVKSLYCCCSPRAFRALEFLSPVPGLRRAIKCDFLNELIFVIFCASKALAHVFRGSNF